jgi:hypothetical protein
MLLLLLACITIKTNQQMSKRGKDGNLHGIRGCSANAEQAATENLCFQIAPQRTNARANSSSPSSSVEALKSAAPSFPVATSAHNLVSRPCPSNTTPQLAMCKQSHPNLDAISISN